MGDIRNGARSFLNAVKEACRFSHMTGFRAAIVFILGQDNAAQLFTLWTPFCTFVENLIALDQWYNQRDYQAEFSGDEDLTEPE